MCCTNTRQKLRNPSTTCSMIKVKENRISPLSLEEITHHVYDNHRTIRNLLLEHMYRAHLIVVLQKRQINPNVEESTRSCADCKDISMTNSANLVHAFERHGEIEYYL
jgi:hypothetical protein